MKKSGFLAADTPTTLSAEYVKEQRAEVVAKHQNQVQKIKDEILVLEGKKASLKTDLALAFKERQTLVEQRENAQKQSQVGVDLSIITLNKQKESFLNEKETAERAHEERLLELRAETRKNESILRGIEARRGTIDENTKRVNDYGLRVAAEEDKLKNFEKKLWVKETDLRDREGKLKAQLSGIENQKEGIKAQMSVLAIARTANAKDITELKELRDSLISIKKQSEEATQELVLEREKNESIRTNQEYERQIKDLETKLKDYKNKLKRKK